MESYPTAKARKLPGKHALSDSNPDQKYNLNTATITPYLKWFAIISLVYLLLVAVSLIGSGFKAAAGNHARELFAFAGNPITGLFIGTICTALIQSSSTVTSIIVGLVAGGLPVSIAIPMVMGANIGTTITNTAVSLGHIKQGKEFQRAFAAATIHDFFNILSVVVFLPLQMAFGLFDKMGVYLASLMVGTDSMSIKGFNFIKPLVHPPIKFIHETILGSIPDIASGIIMITLGIVAIFLAITLMGKLLKVLMVGRAKRILHHTIGRGPKLGILSGTLITVLVQSSSTTTSLIVPLAGNGIFTLRQVYPFTLGANIGTCITALLAATAITGGNAKFALEIALIHLLYNVLGVLIIYSIPFLKEIPIRCAERLAETAVKRKSIAILYVFLVFFFVPGVLITISEVMGW
ncbi:MAG: Na/Pi symporter [Gammaproteobacteria bacterium]|nr:Na/Pi symporter [Gammaproteobacteria bacterium]